MQKLLNKTKNLLTTSFNKILVSYEKNSRLFLIKFFGFIFSLLFLVIVIAMMKPLPPPTDIIVELTEYDTARITWVDKEGSDKYRVYRSVNRVDGFQEITLTTNLHYFDRGLEPDTIYYYKIVSIKRNKESKFSEDVQVVTGSVLPPQNVMATEVGNNYIKIAWDGSQNAERFTVYRTDNISRPKAVIGNTNNEYFTDENLSANTTYYYFVTQTIRGEETKESSQLTVATKSWKCGDDLLYANDMYGTILINNQCWLRENLKYETITGSWCYNDEEENCGRYGRLYNFQTAMQGSTSEGPQGVCPVNWRLPTDEDFRNLEMFLGLSREESNDFGWRGEETNIGDRLKISTMCTERGGSFCGDSNLNIILGGYRSAAGAYRYQGTHSYLWTSTVRDENPIRRLLGINRRGIERDTGSKDNGHYVRCIMN